MDKKQHPSTCSLQETHFKPEDTCRLKVRGLRTTYHGHGCQKKARVAILISDKLDFKTTIVTRDEQGHYIIIKGSIHQEELTIVNIYAPNMKEPKYVNQLILLDNNTIIVGDRSSRQKIIKETMALNDTLDQMDLTDIFRTSLSKAREYTFFSSAHETFYKIYHILVKKQPSINIKEIRP